MRGLALTLPFLVLPAFHAAAEPSLAVRRSNVGNIALTECMDRARAAFTAIGFRLGERSDSLQIGANEDYVASVACLQGQPSVVVVNVAGPANGAAQQFANSVRDGILNAGGGQALPQKPVR